MPKVKENINDQGNPTVCYMTTGHAILKLEDQQLCDRRCIYGNSFRLFWGVNIFLFLLNIK